MLDTHCPHCEKLTGCKKYSIDGPIYCRTCESVKCGRGKPMKPILAEKLKDPEFKRMFDEERAKAEIEHLIRESAEKVMGWEVIEDAYAFRFYEDHGIHGLEELWDHAYDIKDWNPLTNANHLDLVRDKLVEMGMQITERHAKDDDGLFAINICKRNVPYEGRYHTNKHCLKKEDINLTRLTAYVEAFNKNGEADE